MKNKFSGLSFKRDKHFIRNLVIVIGVVLVRRGIWNILDMYLFHDDPIFSNIVSIVVGILILYLPDGTLEHLGGYKKPKEIDTNNSQNQVTSAKDDSSGSQT